MSKRFYELQFEIENMCLLDCIHCSSLDMRRRGKRGYTDEDVIKFISLFPSAVHIYFTGGEPLMYENLLDLCTKIVQSKENVEIGLYTTGNCIDGGPISESIANSMYCAGIKDCFFSIYSDDKDEHDEWTATLGSFANTIESVKSLISSGITPKAHLVLNQFNRNDIRKVIEFCGSLGMNEVRILKLTESGNAQEHWDTIGIPVEEQDELIRQLILEKDNYSTKLTFSGFPELHPCRSQENAVGCQAGTNLLYIDAEGDVFPCACTKRNPALFRIGHITELAVIRDYIISMNTVTNNEICLNEMYASKD